jgi:hypothetical protein
MAKKAKKAKTAKRRSKRQSWTRQQIAELRQFSRDKLPVNKAKKLFKRSVGAIRQKAYALGIPLGHRR